ncbi:LOW QUALITY PROTEIN: PHAF1 protein At3g51130 [Apium graveolens]|uniref:LOW QUALITY PROTEIN: PHAF1 protein At3g51130 n=1 Tax=Apium graveolens TaxID=4045 RepID=UPI003D78BCC1
MPICDAFARIEEQPDIYDVVHVKYSEGPSTPATFAAVHPLFGPTFPGIYDKDRAVNHLFYPGLSFTFPVPTKYSECFSNGEAELPLGFPDGTTPITSRISIYDCSIYCKVGVGSLLRKASVHPLPAGSLTYVEEVYAKLGAEVWFTVGQHLHFGASPHDVWTVLGRPCAIHKKEVHIIKKQLGINCASDHQLRTTLSGDYFYNYFTRGFEISFDGKTHGIKKFILHSKYPGHADFNSYSKCNFIICSFDYDGSSQNEVIASKCSITPGTKWEQVKEILGDCGQAPIQVRDSSSPFGSTSVYGYPSVAFEVMKNGYIATVTLFKS